MRIKRLGPALILVAAGVAWAAGVAGELDDNFGTNGQVTTAASGHLFAVAFDSTGDLLAVGVDESASDAWVVRRYAADGTLEDTFGAAPGDSGDQAHWVAIDGSDRILVAGEATITSTRGRGKKKKTVTARHLAVARFLANGNLDSTFGDGGVATVDLSWGGHRARLAIQSNGKIVVAVAQSVTSGKGRNRTTSNAFVLVRFDSDGALDSGFGDGGIVVDDATSGDDSPAGIGLQSSGKIVVASFSSDGYVVRRYNSDGTVDSGFGSNGAATGAASDVIRALAIDGDDRILLAGYRSASGTSEGLVVRLTSGGATDTGFGSSGFWLSGSSVREELVGIALDGTNIVLGSLLIDGFTLDVTTYRLDTNGDLDSSFGIGGVGEVSSPGDSSQDGVRDMAVDSNGNIALGGENPGTGSPSDWYVIRYCGG